MKVKSTLLEGNTEPWTVILSMLSVGQSTTICASV
jgi:hypothetical protein